MKFGDAGFKRQAFIIADRGEQGREGERNRADALRDRIEALQAQLASGRVLPMEIEPGWV
jgi:hypothetical protein